MVRIINNNLWSPVPWGWGCGGHHSCGGGNNWMNKMLGYQMMFGMINNMFGRCYMTSPQQESFNPYNPYGMMGLQLGGGGGMPQNYDDYLKQQQEKQDFNELKNSYTEFKFTNIGGEYQATLKSDRTVRFSGSNVLELMDEMNAYIDANPDKFTSKPVATDTEGRGELTGNEDAGVVQNNNIEAAQESGNNTAKGVQIPNTWHRRGINEDWFKTNFTDKNVSPTPIEILKACTTGLDMSKLTNDSQVVKDMIKYNPSCFDRNNGQPKSPFPWNKLDIPSIDDLRNTYSLTVATPRVTSSNTFDTDVTRNVNDWHQRDSYNITNNGVRRAMINVTGNGMAQDAELYIPTGPYKGVYRFREKKNNNTVNMGYFNDEAGKIKCTSELKYLELWYDCDPNYFKATGDKKASPKLYHIKKNEDNSIIVNVGTNNHPNWIPLEQFASTR